MADFSMIILAGMATMALWWLFISPYREYRIDLLRERLFAARGKLFDQAGSGEIEFSSSAYGMTRTTMNGMIRFAHELSVYRVFSVFVVEKFFLHDVESDDYRNRLTAAIKPLTEDQRKLIEGAHAAMALAVVFHVAHTSILLAPILIVLKTLASFGEAVLSALKIAEWALQPFRWLNDQMIKAVMSFKDRFRWDIEALAYEKGKDHAQTA
ncbi:MAG: hypothetical protein R8K46_08580 [Mariprofundaceae bacterium]